MTDLKTQHLLTLAHILSKGGKIISEIKPDEIKILKEKKLDKKPVLKKEKLIKKTVSKKVINKAKGKK